MTSYATIAQLRAKPYLDQVKAGGTEDAALQTVLDRANAIISDVLKITFATYGATATDRDVRGDGGEYLRPP